MVNKKAQMKIQQMSFMLVIVFIFFALVAMIAISIFLNNLNKNANMLKEENAKLLASRIANSPEFNCETAYDRERTNCVDLDKVMMLKENIGKYRNFWGVTSLEIRRIYPKSSSANLNIECTKENYPNCDLITIVDNPNAPDRYSYVALCRGEVYNGNRVTKCELGKIIVGFGDMK